MQSYEGGPGVQIEHTVAAVPEYLPVRSRRKSACAIHVVDVPAWQTMHPELNLRPTTADAVPAVPGHNDCLVASAILRE